MDDRHLSNGPPSSFIMSPCYLVADIGVGIHVKRPGENEVVVETELPGPVCQGVLEIDVGQPLRLSIQGGHDRAEVPFANVPGSVTCSFEKLPEGELLGIGPRTAKKPWPVIEGCPEPPGVSIKQRLPPSQLTSPIPRSSARINTMLGVVLAIAPKLKNKQTSAKKDVRSGLIIKEALRLFPLGGQAPGDASGEFVFRLLGRCDGHVVRFARVTEFLDGPQGEHADQQVRIIDMLDQ